MSTFGDTRRGDRVRVDLGVLLAGYVLLRALNAVELWIAALSQAASGPPNPMGTPSQYFVHSSTPASPGLGEVLSNWDGQWYERIAVDGYPGAADIHSPNDAWAWAFPPAFPMTVRALMAVTGAGFTPSAVALNLTLGAIATVLVYLLFRDSVGGRVAALAAWLVNAFPSAPLFMLSFSESMAFTLLLASILAVVRHRHWLAAVLALLLALTRPVAAPLAVVLIVHWWIHRQDRSGRYGVQAQIALAVGVVIALASPWLWGDISAALVGPAATPNTGADRTASIVRRFDFGWLGGLERAAGTPAAVLFVTLVAVLLALTAVFAVRLRLPRELIAWGVAYIAFVFVVTPLHPAMLRYLLLAAPFLVALPLRALTLRRPAAVGILVLVFGALLWMQWFWIRYVYILEPAPALLPFAA